MDNIKVIALKGIIEKDGKILIVKRQDNDEQGAGTWEFPGGKLEFGESFSACLKREFMEEVGINISVGKLLYASNFKTDPQRQVILLCFKCFCDEKNIKLSFEHSDFMWADRKNAEDLLDKGILMDLKENNIFDNLNI